MTLSCHKDRLAGDGLKASASGHEENADLAHRPVNVRIGFACYSRRPGFDGHAFSGASPHRRFPVMTDFVYRQASSFDFSQAPPYRKIATLDESRIEVATVAKDIVTTIHGREETRNRAEPGDRIITGALGERYVIKREEFGRLYERDPSKPSRFISKSVILALPLQENTEILAPWGERQRAAKGGFVVQRMGSPADVYLIDEQAFKAGYARDRASPGLAARDDRA